MAGSRSAQQGGTASWVGRGYYYFSKGTTGGDGKRARGEDVYVFIPNSRALMTTLRGMRGLGFKPYNDSRMSGLTKSMANSNLEKMKKQFPYVTYSIVGGPGDDAITEDWKNHQRRGFNQYQQQVQGTRGRSGYVGGRSEYYIPPGGWGSGVGPQLLHPGNQGPGAYGPRWV